MVIQYYILKISKYSLTPPKIGLSFFPFIVKLCVNAFSMLNVSLKCLCMVKISCQSLRLIRSYIKLKKTANIFLENSENFKAGTCLT